MVKYITYTLKVLLFLPYSGFGQGFQFQANEEPKELFERVFAEFGLTTNEIIVTASGEIDNAEARIENRKRYILYNESWIREMGSTSSGPKNWLKMGIITHELGHHMLGHTLEFDQTNPSLELKADEWSGFAMHKLGASLAEALLAVGLSPNFETRTHPARDRRIVAVTKGYNRLLDPNPNPIPNPIINPPPKQEKLTQRKVKCEMWGGPNCRDKPIKTMKLGTEHTWNCDTCCKIKVEVDNAGSIRVSLKRPEYDWEIGDWVSEKFNIAKPQENISYTSKSKLHASCKIIN